MSNLTRTAAAAFKLACLSMLAIALLSGAAFAQKAEQHPDPSAIFKGQPAFTEEELTNFLVDFPTAKAMKDQKQAVTYLTEKGWTPDRLTYVAAKASLTREVVRRGGTKEVINQLPNEARPQKGELELVKKYQKQIDAIK